ncbi:MAG: LCP family protein [Candidatus Limnocylindria bacterium]
MSERRGLRGGRGVASLVFLVLLAGCATATPSPSLVPTAEPTASPSPTASPTPTPEPTPTPIPLDQAMLNSRLTVLVVGSDSSAYRRSIGVEGYRTDALMVVSISADKSRIDMISLPRDTVDVPMANGKIYHGKINGISETFGIEALRGAMSTLLGVPIDRYVRVDMDDFTWMVDAVGGVAVDVKTRISDPRAHLQLDPGPVEMDGATALAFTRTRADSDYARAARQQQVILALVRKWLDPTAAALLVAASQLKSLETDVALGELPTLLEIGRRSAAATVVAIVLQPPRYSLFVGFEPNSKRGWVMIPNVAAMRRYVKAALAD